MKLFYRCLLYFILFISPAPRSPKRRLVSLLFYLLKTVPPRQIGDTDLCRLIYASRRRLFRAAHSRDYMLTCLSRNCVGEIPVSRLKTELKAETDPNPDAKQISVML